MIKKQGFLGFCGFLGFYSLRYFFTGNIDYLSYIGFFAFFANFFIALIKGDKADERYVESHKTALAFAGQIAIIELFFLWCILMIFNTSNLLFVLLPTSFAITLNIYAIKLYILEEK